MSRAALARSIPPGPAPVAVRAAQPGDEGGILRLIEALAAFEQAPGPPMASTVTLRQALFTPVPRAHAVVAEAQGALVGVALWFPAPGKAPELAYLDEMYVAETSRRQGIGRALFAGLARAVTDAGCTAICWSVLDWNREAQRFFMQIGARRGSGWEPWRLDGPALAALLAD